MMRNIDHWESMIAKMEFKMKFQYDSPPSNFIFKRVGIWAPWAPWGAESSQPSVNLDANDHCIQCQEGSHHLNFKCKAARIYLDVTHMFTMLFYPKRCTVCCPFWIVFAAHPNSSFDVSCRGPGKRVTAGPAGWVTPGPYSQLNEDY